MTVVIATRARRVGSVFISKSNFMGDGDEGGGAAMGDNKSSMARCDGKGVQEQSAAIVGADLPNSERGS